MVTARDEQTLAAIRAFREEHGIPPTIRELMPRLGLLTTSAVAYRLRRLEVLGWLRPRPRYRSRALTLHESLR
jgi:SOS-response transcriptional repressor LexA